MLLFASEDDFEKYADMEAPTNIDRLLGLASSWVRDAVRRAHFDTTPAGLPSDLEVEEALRDATCEQVLVWVQNGVEPGKTPERGPVSSSSIGDASLSYETASVAEARALAAIELAPTALAILDAADLTGGQPWVL
ncbi:hypothetical protein [Corynebacterium liangguodongii]|uniref:Uncharacterized protein n=1 Tax=Corynebacterium liangguodongii TaxID=2079535 RepID=A0A2S0WG93_9CORY|nr:hypothetical protein [Corynebacterium liangguodongii]AWB84780.1 hypothetical protein C3E79_10100 [Corynebacterium liangguodongii]PWB99138.1 hypothetical protein DF219_07715 [Corynebacterium liangguodongii]